MHRAPSEKVLAASLFATLLWFGGAQAATNPFAEARPDSRLPTIAENASDKCAGSGAAQEKAAPAMPCGAAGKCAGTMLDTSKPDTPPAAESDKCGGASGSAKPASE